MFDGRFMKAKNYEGKFYRNQTTKNLEEYCTHCYITYPEFSSEIKHHAGFIPLNNQTFERFTGICKWCGEILTIYSDHVVANQEECEKILSKALKEQKLG